VAKCI